MALNISALAKESISKTLELEGGYVDHKSDLGGESNMGITIAVARRFGYKGEMKDIPYEVVMEIYYNNYWKSLKLDQLDDEKLAFLVYDAGVNNGIGTSTKMLQEACNWAYKKDILKIDGKIGNNTIKALNKFEDKKRIRVLFEMLKIERYVKITRARKDNVSFIYGWSKRCVVYDAVK